MDSDDDIRKTPLNESDAERRAYEGGGMIDGEENGVIEETETNEKEDKKAKKKIEKEMEKERKEEEKRRKKQEKEAEKHTEGGGKGGVEFVRKSFSHLSGFFSSRKGRKGVAKKKEGVDCKVTLLDGSEFNTTVDKFAYGQHLVDKVCDHMNLIEKEYFSLTYTGKRNILFWLRHERRIIKQGVEGSVQEGWSFDFRVKFYTPDPTIMQEDITRYQLCLQLRNDIATGKLPCTFVTYAYLGSYTVQSELGDFENDPNSTNQIDYIQDVVFAPSQTDELLEKIVELHKTHRGQMPSEAELNFLDNAKKLQMYGMHFAPARDSELVLIWLGVFYGGVVVVRDGVVINKFPWPTILKLSYKNKKFYMKIRAAELQQYENTLGFQMESHTHAKNFWRLVMEHHIFFRLKNAKDADNLSKSFSVVHLNSKDRFSGRTHFQTRSHRIHRQQPSFDRTASRNTFRSLGGTSMASDRMPLSGQTDELLNEIGKVSVLAGTGSNAGRLAYVKTVTPGYQVDESVAMEEVADDYDAHHQKPKNGKKKKKSRSEDYDMQAPNNGNHEAPPVPTKPKKKKSAKNGDGSMTEYKTERTAVINTRTKNELSVRREDGDEENYDEALSKAIQSVTELDHGLAVKNIELDTDQLKKKKKKKKSVAEEVEM